MSFFHLIAAASIKNYGAASDGVTDDAAAINQALIDHNIIYFEDGTTTVIGSALSIPSNRTIIIGSGAKIFLKNGASDYMFVNSDFTNGNSNITIIGAGNGSVIDGNRSNQTRRLTAPATDKAHYWGFGMWFVKVKNLVVKDLKFYETNSWALSHYDCNTCLFENIDFEQFEQSGNNGDGVTGFSSNVTIRNLTGYTNDDMVYIGAGGGSIGSTDMGLTDIDISNILIENIRGSKRGVLNCFRGVRVSGRNNKTIRNLTIRNVTGDYENQAIEVANFWPTQGQLYIKEIEIDGVSRVSTATAINTVDVFECEVETFTIKNIKATPNQAEAIIEISSGANCKIRKLLVDGADVLDKSGSAIQPLIYDSANIDTVFINNAYISKDPVIDGGFLYRKTTTYGTRVQMTNSFIQKGTTRKIKAIGLNGGSNLSVTGTSDFVDKADLIPYAGDTIMDITAGLQYYDGTNWI